MLFAKERYVKKQPNILEVWYDPTSHEKAKLGTLLQRQPLKSEEVLKSSKEHAKPGKFTKTAQFCFSAHFRPKSENQTNIQKKLKKLRLFPSTMTASSKSAIEPHQLRQQQFCATCNKAERNYGILTIRTF